MRARAVIFYLLIAATVAIFAVLLNYPKYVDGKIFPPKMPANIEELATWDENDIHILMRVTLKCNEVPGYKYGEPKEFEQWRNLCWKVNKYWDKAHKEKKRREGLEKFKSLNLPKIQE